MAKFEVIDTKPRGVKLITPPKFNDYRGKITEIYQRADFDLLGMSFAQDTVSVSHQNVLRGIHGDFITGKLVTCLYGSIYAVVVNMDLSSDQYLQWNWFNLSGDDPTLLFVPPCFGNGYLVLSKVAVYHYKLTQPYHGVDSQFSVRWNDPKLNIFWPVKDPVLSERDANAPLLP